VEVQSSPPSRPGFHRLATSVRPPSSRHEPSSASTSLLFNGTPTSRPRKKENALGLDVRRLEPLSEGIPPRHRRRGRRCLSHPRRRRAVRSFGRRVPGPPTWRRTCLADASRVFRLLPRCCRCAAVPSFSLRPPPPVVTRARGLSERRRHSNPSPILPSYTYHEASAREHRAPLVRAQVFAATPSCWGAISRCTGTAPAAGPCSVFLFRALRRALLEARQRSRIVRKRRAVAQLQHTGPTRPPANRLPRWRAGTRAFPFYNVGGGRRPDVARVRSRRRLERIAAATPFERASRRLFAKGDVFRARK